MKKLTSLFYLFLSSACIKTLANYDNLYLIAGVGGSFTRCADICVDLNFWDAAVEGYNAQLGKSELYTIGLGYQAHAALRTTFEASFRPSLSYCKFQTGINEGEANFLGNKTRYFNLSNASLMFNAYIDGAGITPGLDLNIGCDFHIQPFIGAGIGLSYNKIYNFHSVTTTLANAISYTVGSAMVSTKHRTFSWQAFAGLEVARTSFCSLDIGYRYFDGGKIKSNNWALAVLPPQTTSPWTGKLRANEFFVNFNLFKDF